MKNRNCFPIKLCFLFLNFLFFSCVTKYEPDIPLADKRQLVVEGLITDEVGPFRVKLTNTFDINKNETFGDPVTTAQVQIFDDRGNLYPLYYTKNGWYQTTDTLLQGVPGTTYDLNITTEDGTQYESTPVLMQDVPDIDSVYFKEVSKVRFENDGTAINENWLNILVDSHDPTGQTKYWKWDYMETWEVHMPKDSVQYLVVTHDTLPYIIVVNLEFLGNPQWGLDNKKEVCWVTRPSASIHVESTNNRPVDEITSFPVTSIPPDEDRLHVKYSILVKQTALSKDLYEFWKRLKEINETSGSMYDKVPSQIFGNIECCNGYGKALGYFSASVVKTKRIFISPHDHNIKTQGAYSKCGIINSAKIVYYYGTITASKRNPKLVGSEILYSSEWCTDCRFYGTNVKPDFWE